MGAPRHILHLATIAVALALLSGCGTEDEEADVREVAAEFFIAVAESSPEACELSSEAERKRIELTAKLETEGEQEPSCEELVRDNEALEESTSALLRQAEEIDDASVEVDERYAVVSFEDPTPAPTGPMTLLLVREQGSWRVDDAR